MKTADPTRFAQWLTGAKPGATFCYYTGFLLWDRENDAGDPVEPVNDIGVMAYSAYESGLVELTQERISDGIYRYLAIKRKRVCQPLTRPWIKLGQSTSTTWYRRPRLDPTTRPTRRPSHERA